MAVNLRPTLKRLRLIALRVQRAVVTLFDDHRMAAQDERLLHPIQKFLFFWVLVGRSFLKNRCLVRATALAYTTLLSLVPLLAVGIGVATSFLKGPVDGGAEGSPPALVESVGNEGGSERLPARTEALIEQVITNVAPQLGLMPAETFEVSDSAGEANGGEAEAGEAETEQQAMMDARRQVVQTVSGFIENVDSAGLGVTGTLGLILVAVGLLSTIESAFNDIWGVQRGRSWLTRLVQYWAAITLGPLILIFAMTFAIGSHIDSVQETVLGWVGGDVVTVGHFLFNMLRTLLPLFFLSVAFALLYQMMPATHVDWRAAAVGGVVGGLLWWLNGQFNVVFASKVVSASKIYGSLGILPVFLLGLYLSWVILLFGAQVSYAFQNRRVYLEEKQAEVVSPAGRELVALRMMTLIGRRFQAGQEPLPVTDLAERLGLSSQLLSQLIETLQRAHLLAEVSGPPIAYQPARPLDRITCRDILEVLRAGLGVELNPIRGEEAREVAGVYGEILGVAREAAERHTLLDLVQRVEGLFRPESKIVTAVPLPG